MYILVGRHTTYVDFNMSWIFQIGKGLLRTVLGVTSSIADVIPVDFPSNLMIVCAWYTAVHKPKPNVQVYNITTGVQNPVTWKELAGQSSKYCALETCGYKIFDLDIS